MNGLCYYDNASIVRPRSGSVRVWAKCTTNNLLGLMEIACADRMIRILDGTINGNPYTGDHEWTNIPPDTIIEKLRDFVCISPDR